MQDWLTSRGLDARLVEGAELGLVVVVATLVYVTVRWGLARGVRRRSHRSANQWDAQRV